MTLREHVRRLAYRHVGGTALVLLYHRVTRLDRDPQLLAVDPERFEQHIRVIAESFVPVSVAELADGLRRRRVPKRAVAVSFDDGYADNLLEAEPLLRRYGVPATVYVSSGYIGANREFWWDELERLLLGPGRLPEHLEIDEPYLRVSASLRPLAEYTEEDAQRDRGWNVLQPPTNERQRLYLELAKRMRPLSGDRREKVLASLRAAAGAPESVRPTHRQLDRDELVRLQSSPVIEVGGHTVSHELLAARALEEQVDQIADDRAALGEWLGEAPRAFSYPYGGLDAYTEDTVRLVGDAGYESACSNHEGNVKPWSVRFRLPRRDVRDWDDNEFRRQLNGWFEDAR